MQIEKWKQHQNGNQKFDRKRIQTKSYKATELEKTDQLATKCTNLGSTRGHIPTDSTEMKMILKRSWPLI